jgi:hypothetical protein
MHVRSNERNLADLKLVNAFSSLSVSY